MEVITRASTASHRSSVAESYLAIPRESNALATESKMSQWVGRHLAFSLLAEGRMARNYEQDLVIDDNSNERNGLCRLLERAGYEVRSAVDGVEALQKIRGDKFDLLLVGYLDAANKRS